MLAYIFLMMLSNSYGLFVHYYRLMFGLNMRAELCIKTNEGKTKQWHQERDAHAMRIGYCTHDWRTKCSPGHGHHQEGRRTFCEWTHTADAHCKNGREHYRHKKVSGE